MTHTTHTHINPGPTTRFGWILAAAVAVTILAIGFLIVTDRSDTAGAAPVTTEGVGVAAPTTTTSKADDRVDGSTEPGPFIVTSIDNVPVRSEPGLDGQIAHTATFMSFVHASGPTATVDGIEWILIEDGVWIRSEHVERFVEADYTTDEITDETE